MKRIDLPALEVSPSDAAGTSWEEILSAPWLDVVERIIPSSLPSEAQVKALREARLLTSRRNVIVSSPTNSGKTLLGYLALLRGSGRGKRALFLTPLRAIAQEKNDELEALCSDVGQLLGREISVEITTGDYRLNEETMQSPPPEGGELVVATPERIESIMRNPEFDAWIQSVGVVVVDEAHLLGDGLRGASLEFVITCLKLLPAPPRIILLSATLGETDNLKQWLEPCDVVLSNYRNPPLRSGILEVEAEDDPHEMLLGVVEDVLAKKTHAALIFVYQTASADALARKLGQSLNGAAGTMGSCSYHSRQSAEKRRAVREAFTSGTCRCVVATTSLGMGVNLPATHVIVRDISRAGQGPVPMAEIIQMAGRAGRGSTPGHALLVRKPSDGWSTSELKEGMAGGALPPIESSLVKVQSGWNRSAENDPPLAEAILSLLARSGEEGMKTADLERFLSATLAGDSVMAECEPTLRWLASPTRTLVHEEQGIWKPTVFGARAAKASIPLSAGSGLAQLIRDLLSVEEDDQSLKQLSKLDLLLLVELLAQGPKTRLKFRKGLDEQVDTWMEQAAEKSVLFKQWVRGAKGFSKADELLGSLGLNKSPEDSRKHAYLATCRAVILWQRGHGVRSEDVARRWKVKDLEDIEERWRDDRLFLLGAMTSAWELRCFYYHLKEECSADAERIQRVKRSLQRLNAQTYQLLDLLSWCSPLGQLFIRMRRSLPAKGGRPAQATMERLASNGVSSVEQLLDLDLKDLLSMGIRKDLARTIYRYVDMRTR